MTKRQNNIDNKCEGCGRELADNEKALLIQSISVHKDAHPQSYKEKAPPAGKVRMQRNAKRFLVCELCVKSFVEAAAEVKKTLTEMTEQMLAEIAELQKGEAC